MGMMISTIAALSTFYHDAKDIFSAESRKKQTYRLVGKVRRSRRSLIATLSACRSYIRTMNSAIRAIFSICFSAPRSQNTGRTRRWSARSTFSFILHADHEQNCSANTIRGVGSSHVDRSATAAAIAALYGPLHGGANEEVLHMLLEIGSVQKVPDFIKRVKAGEVKLMGFGHRVYKNYDPRARIIKHIAYEVFELMGKNHCSNRPGVRTYCPRGRLLRQTQLYPNVDFYTGLIYQSMGFPMTMFPVLFAIRALPAGSRNGKKCCWTQSRK